MLSRRILFALLALLALVAVLASGCTSDDAKPDQAAKLPDAAGLLTDAAAATKKVTSTHFNLQVTGQVAGLDVKSADGDLTSEGGKGGAAQGTANLSSGGQLIETQFVLVDDAFFVKGPTGAFTEVPAAFASQLYNPATILDPAKGVANVLANVKNAKTQAAEDVAGAAAYKVTGKVTKEVIAGLVPGTETDVDVTLWLAQEGDHLPLKASVALPGKDGQPATVVVTLSEINEPVSITAPK